MRDLKRGVSSRFTFDKGGEGSPLFSRDSRRVVLRRLEEGKPTRIVERALDRTGEERVLFESPGSHGAAALSPDGKTLIFQNVRPTSSGSSGACRSASPSRRRRWSPRSFYNSRAALSPDGRWLAFESGESGTSEVYVVGFAGAQGRWQISTRGGEDPTWGPDGRELFYLSPENKLMRVEVTTGA